MEKLVKIFGSDLRIKLLKLFIFNPEKVFDGEMIIDRVQVKKPLVAKELKNLLSIGFIKEKQFMKEVNEAKRDGSVIATKKRTDGYGANPTFAYFQNLAQFFVDVSPLNDEEIRRRVELVGRVKLLIVAGIFTHNQDSIVDLFVVADAIKKQKLDKLVKSIEADTGREIRYTIMDSEEFRERQTMYDRLVRDVLDFPHKKLVNKIGA